MATERAYRNASALSYLLGGVALVLLSLGGGFQFVLDMVGQAYQGENFYEQVYRFMVLAVAVLYFAMGVTLIRARPLYYTTTSHTSRPDPDGIMLGVRLFAIVLVLLGLILLFDFTPYGRDSGLAAVLMVAGVFGLIGAYLFRSVDTNVRAAGGILWLIAAALLLYAQVSLNYTRSGPGDYGPFEVTALVMPPVLGPVAIIIGAVGALVMAYVRRPKTVNVSFLIFGVAALIFGLGLVINGLGTFFDVPWGRFTNSSGPEVVLLLSLTAGIVLITAAGAALIVASLLGVLRAIGNLAGPSPQPGPVEAPRRVEAPAGAGPDSGRRGSAQ